MYVVKVFHGYLTEDGHRTSDKMVAKAFSTMKQAEKIATLVGGRIKKLDTMRKVS